jgi:hypothetical protein
MFRYRYEVQWKAHRKLGPKLISKVDMLVKKLKALNDLFEGGKLERKWNDIIGELKDIIIDNKMAFSEDVNDTFTRSITMPGKIHRSIFYLWKSGASL